MKQYTSESRDFHPLVAEWLTKNGYSYIHEYTMPDIGRCDFYAVRQSDNQVFMIEVELWSSIGNGMMQALQYSTQIENSKPMVIAPMSRITEKYREVADKYGVEMVAIDIGGKPARDFESDGVRFLVREYIDTRNSRDAWAELSTLQAELIEELIMLQTDMDVWEKHVSPYLVRFEEYYARRKAEVERKKRKEGYDE